MAADAGSTGSQPPAVVGLNVGGRMFTTRLATLTSDPDSMLAAMFSGRHGLDKDKDGNFFMDRQGELFQHVLNFLRDATLPPPPVRAAVMKEAQYFQLKRLMQALEGSGVFAEQRVKEMLVTKLPLYGDIKSRLPKLAEMKAADLHTDNVGVSLIVSEVWNRVDENEDESCVLLKSSRQEEKKVYPEDTRDSFESWLESKHFIELPVEEVKVDVQFDEQNNVDPLQHYMYKIGCLLTDELLREGFKVKFMQGHQSDYYIVEKSKSEYVVCRSEVTFYFNFASYELEAVTWAR